MSRSRNEINEIKSQLDNLLQTRGHENLGLKVDVLRKLIHLINTGIDASSLFPQVTGIANLSSDLRVKKLMCVFISHYANKTPELSLLTINLLIKDAKDQNPHLRGLALRTLCSLRVLNLLEYVVTPVQQGLSDKAPYVRRTAVLGVLKIYHLDPSMVDGSDLPGIVKNLGAQDPDAQVVANCLTVLMTIEGDSLKVDKVFTYRLLKMMGEFSEWAQCQALEVMCRYQPESEQEIYDLMNYLDPHLSHPNSAVVLGTVKVFLKLTIDMAATHQMVYETIREPLKTLLARDSGENGYALLSHIWLLVQRSPVMFMEDYMTFMPQMNEPTYNKMLKMQILAAVASESNAYDIVEELSELSNDINPVVAKEAVKAVGQIALMMPDSLGVVERLFTFLNSANPWVQGEALIQVVDAVRRYPATAEVYFMGDTSNLSDLHPIQLTDSKALAAFIWLLGEQGQRIDRAPYYLEDALDLFNSYEEVVKLTLLNASCKLFFKRPAECKPVLGKVLVLGIKDPTPLVNMQASLMYQLLRQNSPEQMKALMEQSVEVLTHFDEELSSQLKDRIFDEFNSLSVIFRQPSDAFLDKDLQYHEFIIDRSHPQSTEQVDNNNVIALNEDSLLGDVGGDLLRVDAPESVPQTTTQTQQKTAMDLEDLLGDTFVNQNDQQVASLEPAIVQLDKDAKMNQGQFQRIWDSASVKQTFVESVTSATCVAMAANGLQDFISHMKQAAIHCLAHGQQPPGLKFFFYGQTVGTPPQIFLVEVIVNQSVNQVNVTVKGDSIDSVQSFITLWKTCFMGFVR